MKKVREREKNKNSRVEELKVKSQAAMEYLMTYGWAILIIALALGVLYSLGIMNPKTFFQELHQVLALYLDQMVQAQLITFLCKERAATCQCMLQASTE